jgi:hypothetical protein
MIKKVIIGLILLVCICSGAFSVIYHYNPTNTSDIDNTDSSNIIGNTNNEDFKSIENNPLTNYINHIDDTSQYSYGYIVNVNGELRHYLNNVSYYLESEGILDRYTQCAECGGYIPIGKITNPLPKAAICHHNNISGLDFSEVIKDSCTRDEAYNRWVYGGMPVCDDEHFNTRPSPPTIDTIYCENCRGIVILKNYTDSLFDYYFNMGEASINYNQYCSHYNGSLDLFDTPIEDFYSGWFKSIDDYNQFMYKAIHSLNDNSTSLENKTLNDISLEKWNHICDVPENFSYVEYKSLNNNISDNPTVIPDVDYEPVYVPEQNILENTSIE